MMDCSSKFVLRTSDQLESAAKAEKDARSAPICNQLSSRLAASKTHFPLPGARVLDPPIETSWRGFYSNVRQPTCPGQRQKGVLRSQTRSIPVSKKKYLTLTKLS